MRTGAVAAAALAAALPALAGSTLAELDGAGRAIAAAGCARPVEEKLSRVAGTGDAMRSLDCRSHRIAYYVAHGREQPMALAVLASPPELPAGLGPGAPAAGVRALLGAPAQVLGHSLQYRPRPRDSITFEIGADGRVRAVSFNWDVD